MQVRKLIALAAALAMAAFTPASAQPAGKTNTASPGLPIWVVRDKDSTIYLTGTVHVLPDDVDWRSAKLDTALKSSSQLYLELAGIENPDAFRLKAKPIILKYATSTGPKLSSLLSPSENAALTAALAKAGLDSAAIAKMDDMRPWYAVNTLSAAIMTGGGFDPDNGIDIALGRMATSMGHRVHGMEEIEDQARVLAMGTDQAQIKKLRALLRQPPGAANTARQLASTVFRAWGHGDAGPLATMMTMAGFTSLITGESTDPLIKDRDEKWAAEIEQMLKGSGVTFIAVGAGHLVGPNSVQARLKLRGIEATRY